ncbi:MAG TPA: deoxyribonuclease IV [Clostridia bacterium]|nr:deoxyribonuclease IV [Clostridia bacterium]
MNIGPHISAAKGYLKAVEEAIAMKADTFQFFTRNPRGGNAKALDFEDIEHAIKLMEENKMVPPLAHAPYTLNLCSAKKRVREFSNEMFADDLKRMESLPSNLYNFHPGSHTGNGVDKGIDLIIKGLNENMFEEMTTTVLLETMSGKGTEIGRNFEEIKRIIDGVELSDKIGVCLDTCHIFSAGYDIVTELEDVIETFDEVIGLDRLKAIHLNDSLKPLSANKDRHARIGEGLIGKNAIINIINHPKLKHLPFYLETPNEFEGYKTEIHMLKKNYND